MIHRLAYKHIYDFGEVWVQRDPATGRYLYRVPGRAGMENWSAQHFGTWKDAFRAAAIAVRASPSLRVVEAR